MRHLALTMLCVAAIILPAAAKGPEEADRPVSYGNILSTDVSGSDLTFFTDTAPRLELIVKLSALAKDRAITPEVQALAAQIWKEQSDFAGKLSDLATRNGVPLPKEPDAEGRRRLQSLAKLKGPKFDKTYLDALSDVQDRVEASLDAGADSDDKEIKTLAKQALATLKKEQQALERLGL